jgi:hypothetical protein
MAMTTADDNSRLYDLSIDLGELDPDPAADTTSTCPARTSFLQWLTRASCSSPPLQGLNGVEEEKEVEPEAEAAEEGAMPGHEKDCQCGKCRLIRAYLAMEEGREVDTLG